MIVDDGSDKADFCPTDSDEARGIPHNGYDAVHQPT